MPADEQLCLDVLVADVSQHRQVDLVDAMICAHGGDYREAIEALMLDADFLRDQLYTASSLMSSGHGRGWKPRYERLT